MPVTADQYWSSYELGTAGSLADALMLASEASSDHPLWVWRGQADAAWGLHSTLDRVFYDRGDGWPSEQQLSDEERRIFDAARNWGLGWSSQGRLSALELLALVRHHGAPSRFIDVSRNALVAIFNASQGEDLERDGRVFAFDGRGHAPEADVVALEAGALQQQPAWWDAPPDWWTRDYAVWHAPTIDDRIVRQQGAFLIGGVPTTAANQKWYLAGHAYNWLPHADVRDSTSIGVRSHLRPGAGGPPERPVRTFRVGGAAKAAVLKDLARLFGMTTPTLYPDAGGFARFIAPQ